MANPEIFAPKERQEVKVTSTYNYPPEQVYQALTDPTLVPQYWGPADMHTRVDKMVVMPGGIWRFVQQDAEGKQYAFHGVYHEVTPPSRLVYTMEYEGIPGHVSLRIDQLAARDRMTIHTASSIFESLEDRDMMLKYRMEDGVTATTLRLIELLAKRYPAPNKETEMTHHEQHDHLKITRIFNAPRERVWQEWTNADLVKCWWGPKDYTSPYARLDVHEGGKYLTCMRGPDGKDVWSTGTFKEIQEPNRIVYSDSFADEHGNQVPATYYGMGTDIPLELEVELTLEDLGGKTRMTLEHCGLPAGEIRDQTREGWNQSFDKLEDCLS